MRPTLAILGGVLEAVAFTPYARDIVRGTTRPHRGSLAIWTVLAVVAFASQLADGATWTLVLVGAQLALLAVIDVLAVRRGVGGASPVELALMAIAALGIAGWWAAADPTVATLCVVFADTVAVVLMLPKTWRAPRSETLSAYVLSGIAAALTALAAEPFRFGLVVYPAYIAIACFAVASLIAVRRRVTDARLAPAAAAYRPMRDMSV